MVKPLKAPKTRTCIECGKEFVPIGRNVSRQICCTIKCWQDRYNKIHDIAGKMREHRRKQKEL
jgi:hypothetical protein